MDFNDNYRSSAQKAAEVQKRQLVQNALDEERKTHTYIMKQLRRVKGYMVDNVWKEEKLNPEDLKLLMDRGHIDEVMEAIYYYGTAAPDGPCFGRPPFLLFPDEFEEFLTQRNITHEIHEYARFHGFGAAGQNVMLQKMDSYTMVWYLERHGFLPEQQKKLLARNVDEEIRMHIRRHNLADEVITAIIDELDEDKTDNFYRFINEREIPVSHQKHLLELMKEKEFLYYINRYGFWEEVLPDLARLRSEEELAIYIRKHRYLGNGAIQLIERHSPLLNQLYAENIAKGSQNFLELMLKVRPVDYKSLSYLFRKLPDQDIPDDQLRVVELFCHATHEEVMAFLTQEKPYLCLASLAVLFYRNIPEEFETYLNLH